MTKYRIKWNALKQYYVCEEQQIHPHGKYWCTPLNGVRESIGYGQPFTGSTPEEAEKKLRDYLAFGRDRIVKEFEV